MSVMVGELTATIVVGRYIRVIMVKILTAAASFVLLSYRVISSALKCVVGNTHSQMVH